MTKAMLRNILLPLLLIFAPTLSSAEHSQNIAYNHAKDIFRSSIYFLVRSNPDGSLISYLENLENGQRLMLLDLQEESLQILINDPNKEISSYSWIDNDTLVLNKISADNHQHLSQLSINFIDGKLTDVYQRPLIDEAVIVDTLPYREDRVLVKQFREHKFYIYNLNLGARNISGQLRNRYKLNRLAPNAKYWLNDKSGNLRIGFTSPRHDQKRAWYREADSKRWKLIWEGDKSVRFWPVLFEEKTEQLLVLSNYERNFTELLRFDIKNKKFIDTVLQIPGYDIESVKLNEYRDSILYASYTRDGTHRRHYANDLGDFLNSTLKKNLNTPNIWVVDSSLNNKTVIALKRNEKTPGIFYLFDTVKWELTELADTQPWLKNYRLGETRTIRSTSIDGLEIESYLTLPDNHQEVLPPLIVMPHGGPISVRASADFDPHVQFLASLGYAVLRPNFRGSSGYGQAFIEAGKRQWGKLIEDDIESAVHEAIAQKLVDSDKVCIYGSSYGGYSALMSAIRNPKLFKCAASYVGVTDISLMYNNDSHTSQRILKWRKDFVGDPEGQKEELMKLSPVYLAKDLMVPVFIAQGEKDRVVDKEHFYRMKLALEAHNKQAEYLLLPEEVHGFSRLQSYYDFYSRLDTFFRKHLGLASPKPLKFDEAQKEPPSPEDFQSLN